MSNETLSGAADTLWELLLRQEPVLGVAIAILLLMLALSSGATFALAWWLKALMRRVISLTERAITAMEDAAHSARTLEASVARRGDAEQARWDRLRRIEHALRVIITRKSAGGKE